MDQTEARLIFPIPAALNYPRTGRLQTFSVLKYDNVIPFGALCPLQILV